MRGGFAATLQSWRVLPLSEAGLLFGIDHSFATVASTTDVIGNSIAVRVLTEWERTFDQQKLDTYVNRRHALAEPAPHPRLNIGFDVACRSDSLASTYTFTHRE